MSLKRQLLIVSLCILVLPWAGCQYIREMELVLRQGQMQALTAHARAVATTVSVQAPDYLASRETYHQADAQLYFYPLGGAPIVDGYSGDWPDSMAPPRAFQHTQPNAARLQIRSGIHGQQAYLNLTIDDPSRHPFNPQQSGIVNGDHLLLHSQQAGAEPQRFYLRAGNGPVTARYWNPQGEIRQEHRIRGVWRDTTTGYSVELTLPVAMLADQFGVTYTDHNTDHNAELPYLTLGTVTRASERERWPYPQPWVTPSSKLAALLAPYAEPGLRIHLVDAQHWQVASAGKLERPRSTEQSHWLVTWLYRRILNSQQFPPQPSTTEGQLNGPAVAAALAGQTASQWYRNDAGTLGQAAAPLQDGPRTVGAVLVEQGTDTLLAATDTAFTRLVLITSLAVAVVALVLVAYASLLSWRIRRLSRAADHAIDDNGVIRRDFIQSRARDEIGDLTRRYGTLLGRLRDYTDYLRTLASKLSHELRTPLAVVKSSLDNLDPSQLSPAQRETLQRAGEGAERLAYILNAMSAANRMEESIAQAQREDFDLAALLRELHNAYRHTFPQQQFALHIEPQQADYHCHGSPELIVQLLDKLVDNAADFTPADGVITLGLHKHKGRISLSVSNDGPPLPEHMQGQLFDSLVSVRQGSQSQTHLGLGLYIVRLIAEFHGGNVSASNRADGKGVIFKVGIG